MTLTLGSLFAGIGGFDLGFERAGFKTIWQCEIDKAAQGVLRRRFPDAALHADVRQVGAHNLAPVDVITFGSPCQDLSVAGKRAGLAGERSGLFHEAARVIRELRERYGSPRFAIWENVPGAFSSNEGRDFAAVVQAMVDLGARDIAWRVLDSRYFGVAQRRRRVFLVADFGGECAEQVLFERESLRGDFTKGGKARKEAARSAGAGAAEYGWVAPAISSKWAKGTGGPAGDECQNLVAQPIPFDTTQLTSPLNYSSPKPGDPCHPLAAGAHPRMKQTTYVAQAVEPKTFAFDGFQSAAPKATVQFRIEETAPLISTRPHCVGPMVQPIAFHPTQDPISSQDGISHTMSNGSKGGTATVAVAVACETVPALTSSGRGVARTGESRGQDPIVAVCTTGEVTHALTASMTSGATEDGTGRGVPLAAHLPAMQVRRLTPTECERLQGFPDGWTSEATLPDGTLKPQADGPRYKQLGNAVTVNVAEWIGRRVAATLQP